MRWSLRSQIMLPLLAVAALSVAAVGGSHAWLATRQTQQRIEQQVRGVVQVLASSRFPLTDSVLRQMRNLSGAEFALTDTSGRLLATSLDQPPQQLSSPLFVTDPEQIVLEGTLTIGGRDYFHTAVELTARRSGPDEQVLHILFPRDEYRAALRGAIIPPIVVGLATLVAVAGVAHFVAGRISRGTARLDAELTRIAGGNFAPMQLPVPHDEIRDLAEAINEAARRLTDYERQVRRAEQTRTLALLGAGLAHELRNAATGCLMAIDLHAETCESCQADESLTVAKRQLRLMESQLQRFLKTGRDGTDPRRERVDVARLVKELLPLVRPAARHADVEIELASSAEECCVYADPDLLGQVVLNLVTNAIEAIQAGGQRVTERRVLIELASEDNAAVRLSVSDTGPGPHEVVAASLFEPFVSNKPEGIGLGLATARQVVAVLGGTIAWDRSSRRTRFHVTLPACQRGLVSV